MSTVFTGLTPAQADGLACVACGEDYTEFPGNTVPVGVTEAGDQVFACADRCAPALRVLCGPACISPTPGVHDCCPGPAAGRAAVAR